MNIINKLLAKEVQIKGTSEINVKDLQKKLKKKGINCSVQELEQRIKEYAILLEEDRLHKLSLVSFVSTIVMLLVLAVELQLRNMDLFVLSNINHILFTVMGFFVIGIVWLRYLLQREKKYKFSRITTIVSLIVMAGLIVTMCLI